MRVDFVEFLKRNKVSPTKNIAAKPSISPCDARMISALSGYKINSLTSINPNAQAKIIYILENHLRAERQKAKARSHHYNSNRHIALLQALAELKSKKTQPEGRLRY